MFGWLIGFFVVVVLSLVWLCGFFWGGGEWFFGFWFCWFVFCVFGSVSTKLLAFFPQSRFSVHSFPESSTMTLSNISSNHFSLSSKGVFSSCRVEHFTRLTSLARLRTTSSYLAPYISAHFLSLNKCFPLSFVRYPLKFHLCKPFLAVRQSPMNLLYNPLELNMFFFIIMTSIYLFI